MSTLGTSADAGGWEVRRVVGYFLAGLLAFGPVGAGATLYSWKLQGFDSGEIFIYPGLCAVMGVLVTPVFWVSVRGGSRRLSPVVAGIAVGMLPAVLAFWVCYVMVGVAGKWSIRSWP